MDKLWRKVPVEYYSVIKTNELLLRAASLMNLKNTGLSERSQTQMEKMVPFLWNSWQGKTLMTKSRVALFWIWGVVGRLFPKACEGTFFWMVYRCPLSRLWWSCLPRVRICQIHWTIFLKGMPLLYINYVNKVDLNRSFPAESTVQPVWRIAGLQLLKTHLCPCCLGQHPAQCQVYNSAFSSQGPLLVVFFFFFNSNFIEA